MGNPDQTYMGSSGYRLVPGNTCDQAKGVKKDALISKKCSQGSFGSFTVRGGVGGLLLVWQRRRLKGRWCTRL